MGKSPTKKAKCDYCKQSFRPQNLRRHIEKCERDHRAQKGLRKYEKKLRAGIFASTQEAAVATSSRIDPPQTPPRHTSPSPEVILGDSMEIEDDVRVAPDVHSDPFEHTNPPLPEVDPPSVAGSLPSYSHEPLDKIRIRYHPRSNRPDDIIDFKDYSARKGPTASFVPDKEPWKPAFQTREDFELAEIMLEASMNRTLGDRLLSVIQACISGNGKVTFSKFSDVMDAWDLAALRVAPFEKHSISVPYKGRDHSFDVWARSPLQWAFDLLEQPQLAQEMVWDAEQIFRKLGDEWDQVIDEPWTAGTWWKIQGQIPNGGDPLVFLLYADKTKLSTFGTEKGYPVIARILNLPHGIRNGNTIGGGCVVGWLPHVSEDPAETGKPGFVNFKRVVWHESFKTIIQPIIEHGRVGHWFKCGDGKQRHLFPIILILSADYEEQSVMALTRGSGGKFPCPICLVPASQQTDLLTRHPLRTAEQSQQVVKDARLKPTLEQRDQLLSDYGLHNVESVFWDVPFMDPHRALSFDRLHSNNSGLGGHHLWEEFKSIIEGYGREASTKVNQHMKILQNMRTYAVLDMYLSFEAHNHASITQGNAAVKKFSELISRYIQLSNQNAGDDSHAVKDWNFPKFHALQHAFSDILAKGATRNFNTKPNEKMHGPLKKAYLL
ncbi:hypothetical protein K488DRAFT_74803 [Vararia minispora EC-137]|uniref:Uncharacterized protein n=1 Tax=Vararia minispora EC-137 TaxID=1314806 RepID=A0ACB8Q638_9AGAM|nr:hypothetical protein K488DRAFT_74803 [Vararia minispora EC-137]